MKIRMIAGISALPFILAGCAATRTTYVDPYGAAPPSTMHWSAYEVFSVISGVILIIAAFLPHLGFRDRFWAAVGGAGLIAYAIYTGHQIEGTYTFPVIIFVIPFAAAIWLLSRAFGKNSAGGGQTSEGRKERE
ncbi:MAG TPA: hypothetical protein VFU65_11025 [Actinocrinis sp.]|nr:hypothetical protein [Actinocrinis sp.]